MRPLTECEVTEVSGGIIIILAYAIYWMWENRDPYADVQMSKLDVP